MSLSAIGRLRAVAKNIRRKKERSGLESTSTLREARFEETRCGVLFTEYKEERGRARWTVLKN
jgi:hypothetical protein